MTLAGRSAVVTGASRGIGRAAAERLAAEGANVVLNSSGTSAEGRTLLDEVVAAINGRGGGRAIASCGPVEDFAYAGELIDTCRSAYGSVDILLNIAGIPSPDKKSILDVDLPVWHRLIDVHLHGTFNCCRHAAPSMVEQGRGAIVNTTSDAWVGSYAGTGYPAAKAATNGLSWAIANDLRSRGVRCNVIAPGARTGMASGPDFERRITALYEQGVLSSAARDAALSIAGPEYVAPAYAYLASDAAAGITGQMFRVSGNLVQHWPIPEPVTVVDRPKDAGPWSLEELHEALTSFHAGWRSAG